ncbi:MAG: hypothetical protein UT61_C0020G0009 [Candidatus Woesebacteria bacterium GW2011_GWA1_39_8]|uniref:Phosphoribosyl-ATP pyrophosphohydrolase n=1 Tax=Candidatus Woesebacteria bacterium GW2011_GWA1_39_8 TaxID=1618552 RepID=A0A0G0PXK1_9BACT|nr:MAG: hypothetical protein UT61_C0020G0009 [Candidatus Woesebacteria bacterium GW2011_GWA1_39_8]
MKKFKFEKLVRDKIVEGIKKSGGKPKFRTLSKHKYIKELKRKLIEEAQELPLKDKRELVKEIADVQEVLDNLIDVLGISKKELKNLQREKNKKAGSFKKRHYISHVELKKDDEWVTYYKSNADRYPEIK